VTTATLHRLPARPTFRREVESRVRDLLGPQRAAGLEFTAQDDHLVFVRAPNWWIRRLLLSAMARTSLRWWVQPDRRVAVSREVG
jgi:hypothetical protein